MTTRGIVREWRDEEGWGVIDSQDTPSGCWAHFSHVIMQGYTSLTPGQPVEMEWEMFGQDGYTYRAVRVWPHNKEPVDIDRVREVEPYPGGS